MQAAFLAIKLKHLDAANQRRRSIATAYSTRISHDRVHTPPVYGEESVAHLYVLTTQARSELAAHLRQAEIATDVHYPIPDHQQPIMSVLGLAPTALPHTEALADTVLTLPCHPGLTDTEVSKVIDAVNSW